MGSRWPEYLTRGSLAFLAFMNTGITLRCVCDRDFLQSRLFRNRIDEVTIRIFACMSMINAAVYLQSTIYTFEQSTSLLAIVSSSMFCTWFLIETLVFRSLRIELTQTFFPFIITFAILIWLIYYLLIWKPWLIDETFETKLMSRASAYGSAFVSKTRQWTKRKKSSDTGVFKRIVNIGNKND